MPLFLVVQHGVLDIHAGSQFESTKTSAAVVHFPGAHRDAAEKMFISLEHEKSGFGKESPGMQTSSMCLLSSPPHKTSNLS